MTKVHITPKLVWWAFLLLLGAAAIAWYGFFEPSPISYRGLPWQMRKAPDQELATVRIGELIPYTSDRCNTNAYERSFITSRYMRRLDAEEDPIRFDSNPTTAPPGCHRAQNARNRVPETATVGGTYYVHGTAEIPGTWRTHLVDWRTEPFVVVPKAP